MSPSSRATRVYLAAGVIAVILVAIALFVIFPRGCGGLLSGGTETDTGECVGAVDQAGSLDPELRGVAGKILAEDDAVAKSTGPYVKVVLLTPLSVSTTSASAMSMAQVRYSLEGSYTALYRANHTADFGDPGAPKVQLLLVNQGSRQEYSAALVKAVLDRSEPDHPVVAVVGLGSSFTGTEATARALSADGIPMVSAAASATTLTARNFTTLHSVSPDNVDYTQALKALLDKQYPTLGLKTGIIVADANDDPYVRTLSQAFADILKTYVKFSTLRFKGGTVGDPATPDVFDPVVTNICNAVADRSSAPLDTVFYAGRVADFKAFAEVLEQRTCRDTPLAVLVGATGFNAAQDYVDILDRGNITVIYSTSADPSGWTAGTAGTPEGFPGFLRQFRERGFADASLADGYAISYHDALVSAVRAIRLAAQGSSIPSPADVDVQFGNLTRAYTVRGASGTFSFADRADGRAKGKVVVCRQLGRTTPYRLPAALPPYLT